MKITFYRTWMLMILYFPTQCSYSQENFDNTWIFANKSSGFNGNIVSTIIKFQDGELSKMADTVNFQVDQNNASISDINGNLLFYTNGCQIIQADHSLMENGDSLNYGKFYNQWLSNCETGYFGWQDIIILNDPANEFGYYIIHKPVNYTESPFRAFVDDIRYSYVNIAENNGKGKVTKKNQIIFDNEELVWSFLTAMHHLNGRDWWILQMQNNSNVYYKFLLDENGVSLKDSQSIGSPATKNTSAAGFAKFSPNGKKWAWYTTENGLNIFDFDRETGLLSNNINTVIKHSSLFSGLEFSPNSRFLYISLYDSLLQVDLWKEDFSKGIELIDTYDGFQDPFSANFHAMNLAPDCKIYMTSTNSTKSLSVINYPNKKGKACSFDQHSLKLYYTTSIGSPNFPRLRVDEDDLCDTVEIYTDIVEVDNNISELHIYPNPIIDISMMNSTSAGTLNIYNVEGALLKTQKVKFGHNYLDMEDLISGIYFASFTNENGRVSTQKIIKMRIE